MTIVIFNLSNRVIWNEMSAKDLQMFGVILKITTNFQPLEVNLAVVRKSSSG